MDQDEPAVLKPSLGAIPRLSAVYPGLDRRHGVASASTISVAVMGYDDDVNDEGGEATLLSLPVEIHSMILYLLDPPDVLVYSRTCKALLRHADSQQLWRYQWSKFSRKTPFLFLPANTLVELGANFKDACRRLWQVLVTEGVYGGLLPAKCPDCKEYTCGSACIKEGRARKVSLDIGSKLTWLITSGYELKPHLSMVALPKQLKCYDCDTTLDRNAMHCDCIPDPRDHSPSLMPSSSSSSSSSMRDIYCNNRLMSSHTALNYVSQPLAEVKSNLRPSTSRPFCLFCEEDKVSRMRCEREMVSNARLKMQQMCTEEGEFMSMSPTDCFETVGDAMSAATAVPTPMTLTNGYCRDTAAILGASNIDVLSPLLALDHVEAFPIVKSFLMHLLGQDKMIGELQRPNCSLIVAYARMPLPVKAELLKFFFEEVKISKLCLLPKALAVCQLAEMRTGIVVDSGATCTYVWIVVDGRVDAARTQTQHVGGWHVAEFLKNALAWRGNKEAEGATVSSLDTLSVKQKCRLSLNIAREDQRPSSGASKMETLHIKSQRDAARLSKLEPTEVTLSSELFLAPEMMYAALDLPAMVQEATRDLPDYLIKDCFSRIMLTGGNTDLQGFSHRLSSDLRELMPEHSPIINVEVFPGGNQSWTAVMGANAVRPPAPYGDLLDLHDPGCAMWMSREEYIMFGASRLADSDADFRNG